MTVQLTGTLYGEVDETGYGIGVGHVTVGTQ
jgi:hypothetical protein